MNSKISQTALVLFSSFALLMSGCSTGTEVFRLQSPVTGSVYLPDSNSEYSTMRTNETVRIAVPSTAYYGFLILNDAQTGLRIPVGVDVHRRANPVGWKTAEYAGYGLCGAGMFSLLTGCIMVFGEGSDGDSGIATPFLVGGSAATLCGVGLGMVGQHRLDQLSYKYRFCYNKEQRPSVNGLATKLLREDMPKGVTEKTEPAKRKKAQSGESTIQKISSSKAKKVRGDIAQNVAGKYSGTGKLLKNKIVDEQYSDIQLIIERIDKTSVKVTVIESDEDFFEIPMTYDVAANGKNGYKLTLQGLPSATILITKAGLVTYTHDKVNIDNELYTLSISAKKK